MAASHRPAQHCFANCARFLMNAGPAAGLTLVHAECTGRGPIEGVRFGHAFLLTEAGIVYDLTADRVQFVERDTYYQRWQVREVVRYDYAALVRKLRSTGHCGPWHADMLAIGR